MHIHFTQAIYKFVINILQKEANFNCFKLVKCFIAVRSCRFFSIRSEDGVYQHQQK